MYIAPIFIKSLLNFCNEAEKVMIVWSHWLLITSFLEAIWWHFTDPSCLGISVKATLIFISVIFLSCFMFSIFFGRLAKMNSSKDIAVKTAPAFLLFLSSLPALCKSPWARTGILAIGVTTSPLLLISSLTYSSRSNKNPDAALRTDAENRSVSDKLETQNIQNSCKEAEPMLEEKTDQSAQSNADHSEIIILVAILINLFTRWCFGTINLFYETWQASLILFLLVFFLVFVTSFAKKRMQSDKTPTKPETNREDALLSHLSLNNNKGKKLETQSIDKSSNDDVSLESGLNAATDPCHGDPKHFCFMITYILGCVQGFTIGTLLVLVLWLLNTPNLLARWGNLNPKQYGLVFVFTFGVGILLSILHGFIIKKSILIRLSPSSKKKKLKQILCINVAELSFLIFLVTSLIAATVSITYGYTIGFSAFSPCVICLVLPCCLSLNMIELQHTFAFSNCNKRFSLLLCTSLCAAISFLLSHLLLIMFINPQTTNLFLGRMDLILTYQVSVIFVSIATSFVLNRFFPGDEKRSMFEKARKQSFKLWITKKKSSRAPSQLPITFLSLVSVCVVILTASYLSSRLFTPKHCVHQHAAAFERLTKTLRNQNHSNDFFSVLNWNVLLGHDIYGRDNLPCLNHVLKLLDPDIIGLEESDALPSYWGGKDVLYYLSESLGPKMKSFFGVNPLLSSLGVGFLSKLPVTNHRSYILPIGNEKKLPHYSLIRIDCQLRKQLITVFNIHAVYKNWSNTVENVSPLANLSTEQIHFVADEISKINQSQPIIVMGDFNLNPDEAQLDIIHDLDFQSALHPKRDMNPPSTLRNRFAIVDHIFYRGLNLLDSRTVVETEDMSDHSPVMALFDLPS